MLLEPRVATLVALRAITHVVADAVDLDREPRFRTIEIEYIRANRMLTTKDWFVRLSRA